MTILLEFLERHRARYLFRSSHLKCKSTISLSKKLKMIKPTEIISQSLHLSGNTLVCHTQT